MDALGPDRADVLLAALWTLAGLVAVAIYAPAPELAPAVAVTLAQGVALSQRRRFPLASWCVAFACYVPMSYTSVQLNDAMVPQFAAGMFASYSLGANLATDRAWPLVAVLGTGVHVLATFTGNGDGALADLVWGIAALLTAPVLVGRLVRRRGQLNEALRARAAAAVAARERAAADAVAGERERIAADLHDVVAHALSAMVVQAAVARRAAGPEPDRARAAFAAVESTGREALTEVRRLLGVLRRGDEDLALAPQPSLEHVRSLVERVRRAGLAVDLTVDGDRRALPAGVDLTGYRVVQAALEGARAAGGAGAARVALRYEPDAIALEVRDDGPGTARDFGGSHERVSLYGGELRAAPQQGGGHAVLARLPVGAPA
ncbi:MAG: sensor histidine kinase [Solirubrobacteraceae bacterium]